MNQRGNVLAWKNVGMRMLVVMAVFLFGVVCLSGKEAEAASKTYATAAKAIAATKKKAVKEGGDTLEYGYLKLRYGSKTATALEVKSFMGRSYVNWVDIYIKTGGKWKKFFSPGAYVSEYTKDRKYLITRTSAGAGVGGYDLYQYSSSAKKYIRKKSEYFDNSGETGPKPKKAMKNLMKYCPVSHSKFIDAKLSKVKTISLY